MKVLVVFPIINPEKSFFSEIIPLLQDQVHSTHILLINSGSNVSTGKYEVIEIDPAEFNHANTRNLALNKESDFYLFMTQDAMPYDDKLIENLLKSFNDPDVVVSYARQIPYPEADPIERFARETNYPDRTRVKSKQDLPEHGIKTFFSSDSCALYRGDYFRSVNGFKKDLNTNEDMEFAARAILNGKKIAYCADAKVFHSHQYSFIQIWKRYTEIGRFFAQNKWILNEVSKYKKAESSGIKQALHELWYITKKSPLYLLRSLVISLTKFIAFKYGQKQ